MKLHLNHLQAYLAQEFVDDYHEGHLTRREMIARILGITGGVASAATLLLSLGCQPAAPQAQPTLPPTRPAAASPTAPPKPTALAPAATSAPSPTAAAAAKPAAPSPTAAAAASPTAATKPAGTPGGTAPAGTAPAGTAPAGTAAPATKPGAPQSKFAVPPDDAAITASDVTFSGNNTTVMAYLAQPKTGGPFPAVMVCHENRGLLAHFRDVARRLAKAGFVALAVDLLSHEGGTAKVDPAQVPGKLTADPARNAGYFQAAFQYLQSLGAVQKASIGMVGFCFGGGMTWLVAQAIPDLKAAVPFYGPIPPLEDVPKIKAAVLALYGGEDQRVNAGIPAIEDAMKKNGKTYEKVIYPGAGHGFYNDTEPARWNQEASYDAWEKALAWFKKYLV